MGTPYPLMKSTAMVLAVMMIFWSSKWCHQTVMTIFPSRWAPLLELQGEVWEKLWERRGARLQVQCVQGKPTQSQASPEAGPQRWTQYHKVLKSHSGWVPVKFSRVEAASVAFQCSEVSYSSHQQSLYQLWLAWSRHHHRRQRPGFKLFNNNNNSFDFYNFGLT